MDLINKFKEKLIQFSLIEKGDRLLLGVSGGPDSLTMLDLFNRTKDEFNLKLVIFHLNHCFRSEAKKEARYVEKICEKKNLPVVVKSFDVSSYAEKKGLTPEEAAREVRFSKMKKILLERSLQRVCLGHNRDDVVETVLFNLFRGCGLRGLKGIEPKTVVKGIKLIHPLLFFTRQQIESYCELKNLNPVSDPTNNQSIYTRNQIRNEILPLIEEKINPQVKKAVFRTSELVREVDNYLSVQVSEEKDDVIIEKKETKIVLKINQLQSLAPPVRKGIIRDMIVCLKGHPDNIYYNHFQKIEELIFELETGKKIELKDNIIIKKVYDKLILSLGDQPKGHKQYCYRLSLPGKISLSKGRWIKAKTIDDPTLLSKKKMADEARCFCDIKKVKLPLRVRNRKPGDKIQPLGMKGTKKVKDIFIDQKIDPKQRELIPLVIDDKQRIIWVVGLKMDDRFKIEDSTEEVLALEYNNYNRRSKN